ncbi:hypothetical protein FQU23_015245 [Flavobacterium sp. XN-5]|uniref:hypothetical protein n=1 Tax=Flavobacterium sp. XN-5 TaxID=2599390 RepID=UPI0011C927AB|nr:hypothetical protein [Flavobacterium sp. XN-5]NGY38858.1 hypothetical protein [Flavobacterium sp. XN-5]
MKKIIKIINISLFCTICFFTSCKEVHKMNIEAESEAEAEIKSEKLDEEIKMLEYQQSKLPKSESEIKQEESEKQQEEMNNNKSFSFSKNKDIGFVYVEIKKIKFNCTDKESEVNAKYKLYLKAKELKGDGIIDYKINFTPFYSSGTIVKKK